MQPAWYSASLIFQTMNQIVISFWEEYKQISVWVALARFLPEIAVHILFVGSWCIFLAPVLNPSLLLPSSVVNPSLLFSTYPESRLLPCSILTHSFLHSYSSFILLFSILTSPFLHVNSSLSPSLIHSYNIFPPFLLQS